MPYVQSQAQLINDLQTQYTGTYRDIINRDSHEALKLVVDVDSVTANNRTKTYGFRDSAPGFHEWKRHKSIPSEGMGTQSWIVENFKWGKRLQWLRDDREDDQTQSLMGDASAVAKAEALHAELMFFDSIYGTTNDLPVALNAPDGVAPFDTATRFGASGGNQISTYGVGDSNQVLTGYHDAMKRLGQFQDTKTRPLWTTHELDGKKLLLYSIDDRRVVLEGFKQKLQPYANSTSNAGVSNLLLDIGENVVLWGSARVTAGEAFLFLTETPVPFGFVQNRTPMEELSSLNGANNSDLTAETDVEWVQWRFRVGFGNNLPYGAIKLT